MLRGSSYQILSPLLIRFNEFPPHLKNPKDSPYIFISEDIKEVLCFSRDHGQDSPEWKDFLQSRRKLLDEEIPKRRQETYHIKRCMIKHHLLNDRTDFRYV
jgi:hypothetical protein